MSLAATFPIKPTISELCIEDLATIERGKLVESSVVFPGPEPIKELEDIKVEEMEAHKVKESPKVNNKVTKNNSHKTTQEGPNMIFGNKKISNNYKEKYESAGRNSEDITRGGQRNQRTLGYT